MKNAGNPAFAGQPRRSGRGGRRFKSCHSYRKKQSVSASRLGAQTDGTAAMHPCRCIDLRPTVRGALAVSASADRVPIRDRWTSFTSPLAKAEKAQYRYHDDHRSNEPNDVVHDLSPVAWGSPRLWRITRAGQPSAAQTKSWCRLREIELLGSPNVPSAAISECRSRPEPSCADWFSRQQLRLPAPARRPRRRTSGHEKWGRRQRRSPERPTVAKMMTSLLSPA
jgi:hypothetical protein